MAQRIALRLDVPGISLQDLAPARAQIDGRFGQRDPVRSRGQRSRALVFVHRAVFGRLVLYLSPILLCMLWSAATPLFASPDEPVQVIKAVAVAHGQFIGTPVNGASDPRTIVDVPAVYVSGLHLPGCFVRKLDVTAACSPAMSSDTALLHVAIYVGRYPPLYYAIVGLPSLFVSSRLGVYLMRFVSALLSGLFLSLALFSVVRWSKNRLLLVGVLLAITPEVLFFGGVVNPSSLEISSALCLWTAGLVLVLERWRGPPTGLIAIVTVAAVVEACSRGLSPLWVLITGLCLAALARRRGLSSLIRCRAAQIGLGLLVATTALACAWILLAHSLDVQQVTGAAAQAIKGSYLHEILRRQELYLKETIGQFGWTDTPAPSATYLLWCACAAVIGVVALLRAATYERVALLAFAVLAVGVPIGIVLSQAHSLHGLIWQGRDGAPLVLGLPILSAAVLVDRGLPRVGTKLVTPVLFGAIAVAQVVAFAGTLQRYTSGIDRRFDFFANGVWQPLLGSRWLLLLFTVSVVAFVLAVAARLALFDRETTSADASP